MRVSFSAFLESQTISSAAIGISYLLVTFCSSVHFDCIELFYINSLCLNLSPFQINNWNWGYFLGSERKWEAKIWFYSCKIILLSSSVGALWTLREPQWRGRDSVVSKLMITEKQTYFSHFVTMLFLEQMNWSCCTVSFSYIAFIFSQRRYIPNYQYLIIFLLYIPPVSLVQNLYLPKSNFSVNSVVTHTLKNIFFNVFTIINKFSILMQNLLFFYFILLSSRFPLVRNL